MASLPELPTRFPCWCKATYSWGGETKKDLGFIEGDLIECLNAGDGSWWMGRLRRDPRAIGLFPSNFVTLLADSYQPPPNQRNYSPRNTPPKSNAPAKSKSVFRKPFQAYEEAGKHGSTSEKESTPESDKEKARKDKNRFKPYNSMKTAQAPTSSLSKMGGNAKEQPSIVPAPPPRRTRVRQSRPSSPNPGASSSLRNSMSANTVMAPIHNVMPSRESSQLSYRAVSPQPAYRRPASPNPQMRRAPSPQPYYEKTSSAEAFRYGPASVAPARSHSPLPSSYHDGSTYPQLIPSREPSPAPYQQQHYESQVDSRVSSYNLPDRYRTSSSSHIENDDDDDDDAPPPPPPAHRVLYQQTRAPSPQPHHHDYHEQGYDRDQSRTPVPPSPGGGSHMTPSPLRDAINDVMSSLHDMSFQRTEEEIQSRPTTSGTDVWSPDEFELVRRRSQQEHQRAQSSLGFSANDQPHIIHEKDEHSGVFTQSSRTPVPELEDYVTRMEHQLGHQKSFSDVGSRYYPDQRPAPPLKGSQYAPARPPMSNSKASSRPTTSESHSTDGSQASWRQGSSQTGHRDLRQRKSAYELGRTQTTKTNITNSTVASAATQSSNSTNKTLMSGYSAGGFSATSAGSLARRRFGLGSQRSTKGSPFTLQDSKSAMDVSSSNRSCAESRSSGSGPSYHSSHATENQQRHQFTPATSWSDFRSEEALKSPEQEAVFGGLGIPKARKSGFFKKMIESAKTTARTGAANARSTIGSASASRPGSRSGSPTKSAMHGFGGGPQPPRPGSAVGSAVRDQAAGSASGGDWMQVRRDINRSNTLSKREREERAERCEMLEIAVIRPIEEMLDIIEGGEGLDGLPITDVTNLNTPNLALVDKSTRFIHNTLPPMITASSLAQQYVCRPYRSDVQRLRAIFTWVAERVAWEEDFEGAIDTRRVISTRRGCSQEIATLVRDMCSAVGLHAEVVRGFLKAPGETVDLEMVARPNHWWNAVIVDGEWRILDCTLASPTYPLRAWYSIATSQVAETWYFLARPSEVCYTHIPLLPEQQHIVPCLPHEVLCALPCATPAYFQHHLEICGFETSDLYLEHLEIGQFQLFVPEDIECVAEVEAKAFARDADGDLFESGDVISKRALSQAEWVGGRKRYTLKAVLPGDEGQGMLKIYAGKRGLMHSIKDNPHALAVSLPLHHTGQNPPYDFLTRHPTPHAQRHDLYVAQPQCTRLVTNNTYVFCVRQHPSSLSRFTPDTWGAGNNGLSRPASPNPSVGGGPFVRPGSAMSMISTTTSHQESSYSSNSQEAHGGGGMTSAQQKPAKLAIQTPSQKIIRLTRKAEQTSRAIVDDMGLTTEWETVIKVSERGTWRALVLADRSARWCVFAEWECL
ncbi:hypothetical protein K431DRAFT_123451 [Polychaeton citri CBS 116435]|uniref:SH3 domain-containing protein n=1 Tax=Polychaeton citri CBS 116435 TaxID=1314669 RepID=A0A9P4Q3C1_9PEZI|nr:hypothetical protein K431DRAFT_123451 [Polychaeton citri CBS 116435]